MFSLEDLGWGPFFQQQLNRTDVGGASPARVVEEMKSAYRVYCEHGPLTATVSGRLRHEALTRDALPATGDWVLVSALAGEANAIVHRVLGRRTKLSRKVAGERTEEQVLAANVDAVFVVAALNRDFNPRRIERYLTVAWQSGARPVVVLNKGRPAQRCPGCCSRDGIAGARTRRARDEHAESRGRRPDAYAAQARRDSGLRRLLRRRQVEPTQLPARRSDTGGARHPR